MACSLTPLCCSFSASNSGQDGEFISFFTPFSVVAALTKLWPADESCSTADTKPLHKLHPAVLPVRPQPHHDGGLTVAFILQPHDTVFLFLDHMIYDGSLCPWLRLGHWFQHCLVAKAFSRCLARIVLLELTLAVSIEIQVE